MAVPRRTTRKEAQRVADSRGKLIRIIEWTKYGSKDNKAECLRCGKPFTASGNTMLAKNTPYAGCGTCKKEAMDFARRRYDSPDEFHDIIHEKYSGTIWVDGIDENTTINDDADTHCSIHGFLGNKPIRNLVRRGLLNNPCEDCQNKGGHNKLTWEDVQSRLDAPGALKNGMTYKEDTFEGANEKMTFFCPIPGHGDMRMTPKQVYVQGHGCRKCGIEKTASLKRTPTSEIRRRMVKAQGGRHQYPKLSEEHGGPGTGWDSTITVVCLNGHEFPRRIEEELRGAGCRYCPGGKSSQQEAEISFELGQFDDSWDPFDRKVEGVQNKRLDVVDMKLFCGRVIIESDPAWYHAGRRDADQRKTDALLSAKPPPSVVYRIREDDPAGNPLPLINGATTIRVQNNATVKEIVDAVINQLISDSFLDSTEEIEAYLMSESCTRSGEARRWYSENRQILPHSVPPI